MTFEMEKYYINNKNKQYYFCYCEYCIYLWSCK